MAQSAEQLALGLSPGRRQDGKGATICHLKTKMVFNAD